VRWLRFQRICGILQKNDERKTGNPLRADRFLTGKKRRNTGKSRLCGHIKKGKTDKKTDKMAPGKARGSRKRAKTLREPQNMHEYNKKPVISDWSFWEITQKKIQSRSIVSQYSFRFAIGAFGFIIL